MENETRFSLEHEICELIKKDNNSEILDLKIKNIDSLYFLNNKVIAIQKNGKIGVL